MTIDEVFNKINEILRNSNLYEHYSFAYYPATHHIQVRNSHSIHIINMELSRIYGNRESFVLNFYDIQNIFYYHPIYFNVEDEELFITRNLYV